MLAMLSVVLIVSSMIVGFLPTRFKDMASSLVALSSLTVAILTVFQQANRYLKLRTRTQV